jgi:hypothetical protein
MGKAVQHRIEPLLFRSLEEMDDSVVPPEPMESLRIKYFATARRNLLSSYRLAEILEVFLDAQIKVIVLKGMALCETVYRDTVPRPFGDIDLLIPGKDRHKAGVVLSQLGYGLSPRCHESFAERFGVALTYVKGSELPIDLHWHLIELPYSKYVDADSLWRSAVSLNIQGVDTLILSPEDLLIYLCLHVSKEQYCRLLWLVDISEVIHHYSELLNWKLILEKAEQYRIRLLVHHVLELVNRLFGPPIPEFVMRYPGSRERPSFEERLFGALADPGVPMLRKLGTARLLKLYGTGSKTRCLFGELLPDKDFMLKRYPGESVHVSYCLRVWNTLCAAIGVMVEALQISIRRRGKAQP